MADGRIQAVGGPDTPIPDGATRIDGHGKWVTPGVIDVHSPSRRLSEPRRSRRIRTATRRPARSTPKSGPSTASGRRIPASAARSPMAASPRCRSCPARPTCSAAAVVTCSNVPARTVQGDAIPGRAARPQDGLRRESQARLRQPQPDARRPGWAISRSMRATWQRAVEYRERDKMARRRRTRRATSAWTRWSGCSTGEMLVHNHCYRADEMAIMHRYGARSSASTSPLPPRGRGLQDRRSAARQRHLRGDVGRLVGLQDGSL